MVLKAKPTDFRSRKYVTIGAVEYRIDDLGKAFDFVADPDDWRAAIYCKIQASEFKITSDAVWFYTGTDLTLAGAYHEDLDGRTMVEVKAVGHRNGPAGDH